MTSFFTSLGQNFHDWETGFSPEVDSWALMQSPSLIISILTLYLLFVLSIGPSYMKDKKPWGLYKTLIVYNGFQVLFSMFIVYKCALTFSHARPVEACTDKGSCPPENKTVFYVAGWWYVVAKVSELTETVFFVLRKKTNQISFLHVYHHSTVMFFAWCFLKYFADEQGVFIGVVNSGVHVVMYFYYMLSAFGPRFQKFLWWKKYITTIQLVQFCVIIAYVFMKAVNSNSGRQRTISYFFMLNAFVFLYLFSDFYRSTYKKKAASPSKEKLAPQEGEAVISQKYNSTKFVDDSEAYSRITKDVELLNQGMKLRKIN